MTQTNDTAGYECWSVDTGNNCTVINTNSTMGGDFGSREDLPIWHTPSIRITFIVIHFIVFLLCFLGNFTVILVVTLHWKMRSITNFCLANLAVADLCVAIFCVFQNLYAHMSDTWVLGTSICKIYHFINEMSLTASVLILVVISIERCLAIKFPMKCKSWLTVTRLRLTLCAVWGISGIYSVPRFYYTTVISHVIDGTEELICTPNRQLYNSNLFDAIHMGLLFLFPLLVITVLYTIIGIALWRSSRNHIPVSASSESSSTSDGGLITGGAKTLKRDFCQEVLCCSSSCLRGSGFIWFRSTPSSSKRGPSGIRRMNNEINGKHPTGENTCEFNNPLRNSYAKELSSEEIIPREQIVVVKYEKANRSQKTKRCKIIKVSKPLEPTDVGIRIEIGTPNQTDTVTQHSSSLELSETKGGLSVRGVAKTFNESKSVSPQHPNLSPNSGGSSANSPAPPQHPLRLKRMRVLRGTNYGTKALEARRKIIKLLIVIVLTFALCNLPFHGRKIWQNWSSSYRGTGWFSEIFTQVTTIIRYANSAINPLLHAFMSEKFRQCLGDFLGCRLRRKFRTTRNFSVRSTHVVPVSMAG